MQNKTVQANGLETENQNQAKVNNIHRYWDTAADGEKVWNYVLQQEGNARIKKQNPIAYKLSGILAAESMMNNKDKLASLPYTDKYKHALINCKAAQYGEGGNDVANVLSLIKEVKDVATSQNTIDSSQADLYANKIGRLLGTKYPQESCEVLVPQYIKMYYK